MMRKKMLSEVKRIRSQLEKSYMAAAWQYSIARAHEYLEGIEQTKETKKTKEAH